MLTYPYVEDYLEVLAGYDPSTTTMVIFPTKKDIISLARYDYQIVDSMANATMFGGSLTDRQGELVIKLVLKYRRQFTKVGIDITPVENPQWRVPLRKIDRARSLWIEDGNLLIKFPYDQDQINELREFKSDSQGSAKWNNHKKVWQFGITEYNVNWLVSWAQSKDFSIQPDVIDLFNQILACEAQPYSIELVNTEHGLTITNASDSLLEYIDSHVGGLTQDNLVKLIDYAGVLGYTVSSSLLEESSRTWGMALEYIGTKHKSHISPLDNPNAWDWVLDYAELTQRYPICVYDPGLITDELVLERFSEQDIVRFDHNGKTKTSDYDPYNVKIIYARKIPGAWEFPVPLLVSTTEMMYGGKRLEWLNRAEKIVYLTDTKITENN
jgi:hypothetical protein